ncbi:MAG: hypothetical protein AB1916_06830 [Thermodesulfobacteriota bacterium]
MFTKKAELAAAQAELEGARRSIEQLTEDNRLLCEWGGEFKRAHDELADILGAKARDLDEAKETIRRLTAERVTSAQAAEAIRTAQEEKDAFIQDVSGKYEKAKVEMERAFTAKAAELDAAKAQIEARIQALETKHRANVVELEALRRKLNSKKEIIRVLKRKLDEAHGRRIAGIRRVRGEQAAERMANRLKLDCEKLDNAIQDARS